MKLNEVIDMGCDIHSFVAVLGDDATLTPSSTIVNISDKSYIIQPFDGRCYLFFGWLTNSIVRSRGLEYYNYPFNGRCLNKINISSSDNINEYDKELIKEYINGDQSYKYHTFGYITYADLLKQKKIFKKVIKRIIKNVEQNVTLDDAEIVLDYIKSAIIRTQIAVNTKEIDHNNIYILFCFDS